MGLFVDRHDFATHSKGPGGYDRGRLLESIAVGSPSWCRRLGASAVGAAREPSPGLTRRTIAAGLRKASSTKGRLWSRSAVQRSRAMTYRGRPPSCSAARLSPAASIGAPVSANTFRARADRDFSSEALTPVTPVRYVWTQTPQPSW